MITKMKRIILDTNIYGELAIDKEIFRIIEDIKKRGDAIYGTKIIRKELRETSKKKVFEEKNLRITMLTIYDQIVKEHNLDITWDIRKLTNEYGLTYKNLGGGSGADKIENDFLIVACAALNNLDVVVSDDCHSLCSEKAIRAYKIVNDLKKIRNPQFLNYSDFRRWFS